MSVWDSWVNAERYEQFVRERGVYAWLNRQLVASAELESAERILDLGCGTGATARACLTLMQRDAELVGIDASTEMVAVANAHHVDPRVSFEARPASALRALDGTFDRVLSNAAFWQFPRLTPVFAGLQHKVRPAGRVLFNVPAERIDGERTPIHPFQAALMREVDDASIESAPVVDRLSRERLAELAERHGFSFDPPRRLEYQTTQRELYELMSLPAMIEPLTPELDDAAREAILARAIARTDGEERVAVPWLFFSLTRRPGGR